MSVFTLRKLIVYKECGHNKLKVLKPEEFIFTDSKYDDFYDNGVVIHAVVGKNGSGKSSLVDMLFRISNNLAALMFCEYERPSAGQIYFIKGVIADLFYTIDGKEWKLHCENEGISLSSGEEESFEWSLKDTKCVHKENGVENKRESKFEKEVRAARDFFYTIATNYSTQAYITNDYTTEKLLSWNPEKRRWIQTNDAISWLDGIFHKNDGYMSPIVLNPYRQDGIIDMAKEEKLTTNRLSAILWETKSHSAEEQMIEGYRLYDIEYEFRDNSLDSKFDKSKLKSIAGESIFDKFSYAYEKPNSLAKTILRAYKLPLKDKMSRVEVALRIYLTYKTLRVADKYPSYSHFKSVGDVNLVFQSSTETYYHKLLNDLVAKIKKDTSHITLKIRQTLKLIEIIRDTINRELLGKKFTYQEYQNILNLDKQVGSVEKRNELLPPPIFRAKILLIKNENYQSLRKRFKNEVDLYNACRKKAITLDKLSSGERQLIYMSSTLVYHILNLKSIPADERIKYNQICMVLDEVEISFHPEYQRTFIKKFLDLISRMKLTESFGISVLVVTHSPFVLSDIPQGNIMYMENGHQLTKDEIVAYGVRNPFCANINDILHQSFFLSKGFVGEFAKQKVLSLADYLTEDKNDNHWSPIKAKAFIDEVGEPLVREHLLNLYIEKFGVNRQEKIAMYQAEIERLQKEER